MGKINNKQQQPEMLRTPSIRKGRKLIGLLMGYPECCADAFSRDAFHTDIAFGGFKPCKEHQKSLKSVEDVEKMLGRSLKEPPAEAMAYVERKGISKGKGLRIYKDNKEFFLRCWDLTYGDE